MMIPQLRRVTEILEEAGADYWLDFGTLLGLVREGRLLASDGDLDISARFASEAQVDEIADRLESEGYRVSIDYFHGLPYKLKATSQSDGELPFDLDLFRHSPTGSHLWCPQLMPVSSKSFRTWPAKLLHFAYKHVITALVVRRGRTNRYGGRLTDPCFGFSTWWIPADQIGETIEHPTIGYRVPADVERHLTLHYGDWRVPKTGWLFQRDDKSLHHQDPRELLEGTG